jgi:hypothetical protein
VKQEIENKLFEKKKKHSNAVQIFETVNASQGYSINTVQHRTSQNLEFFAL